MAHTVRQVKQRNIAQATGEAITYTVDFRNWGTGFTSPSATIKSLDETTLVLTDETGSLMSGAASVVSDIVTLPQISGLSPDVRYKVEVSATLLADTMIGYFWLEGE